VFNIWNKKLKTPGNTRGFGFCSAAIQEEMKVYISELNDIKGNNVKFNCRCNEYGRSSCLCVTPFRHVTTFLFVMFSYYVANYPQLRVRSIRKSHKVLEFCNLSEENVERKKGGANLESTMRAISTPAEFFK
jgi:hypothetical protein